jgi:hypothetical protein
MPTLSPLALALAAASAASASAPCSTASDCSLNGDCVSSACVCDAAWSGSPACDVLALLPTPKRQPGYRNSSGVSSWGGMSLWDATSSLWHFYAAEMVEMCPLGSWKTNSRVVHGVSAQPAGPFNITDEVFPPFATNPKIYQDPVTKKWVLFFIGGQWTPAPENCTKGVEGGEDRDADAGEEALDPFPLPSGGPYPGPTQDGCGPDPLNGGCGLALGTASGPYGPWTLSGIIVQDQNISALLDCAHTNPSVHIFPNGSALMAFNAGYCHGNLETIGILQAPSVFGPWTFWSPDPILLNPDGSPHKCEDPFLWVDGRGWHLMVHNQQGANVALYAHSVDGRNWTLHNDVGNPGPYNDTIVWDDGTEDSFDVERPQFVRDPATGKPLYLTNGALASPSFTLFRPLKQG